MEIVRKIKEMQDISDRIRSENLTIACVPTMGYLHKGHLELIKTAQKSSDVVVTTLFVNPLQFGANEDLDKYPRDFDRDFTLAENNGSEYLFYPEDTEMYTKGFQTSIVMKDVTGKFEGISRPGHFDGVATVVAKLFNAVKPNIAIFGQKDYQQTILVKQLVADLNFDIEIIVVPTIREQDGLAMSSRNVYLSKEEREIAPVLYQSLTETRDYIFEGNRNRKLINDKLNELIELPKIFDIDYAVSASAETLDEPDIFPYEEDVVLLVAAKLGKTRLIDNIIVKNNA